MQNIIAESANWELEKYKLVLKHMPYPICIVDEKRKIEYINDRFTKVFGYTLNDIPQIDDLWLKAFPDEKYRKWVINNWENAKSIATINETDIKPNTFNITCKKGDVKQINLSGELIDDSFLFTFNDVTEKAIAEKALKDNKDKLETIIAEAEIVLYAINKKGIFTFSEGNGLKKVGLKPGQVVGLSVFDVYKDYPKIVESIKEALKGQKVKSILEVGSLIFETTLNPVFNDKNEVEQIIGVSIDITDEQRIKEELQESENKIKQIFNSVSDGIIITDLEGNLIEVNQSTCNLYGYTYDEMLQLHPTKFIHPSGRNVFQSFLEDLKGKGSFEGENLELRKDGTTFSSYVVGNVVNLKGNPHLLASVRDISKRKEAEADVEQFFNTTAALLCIANTDGYFLRLNNSWEKLLGWTKKELMSKPLIEFVHPDDVKPTLYEIVKQGKGNSVMSFTNRYVCKDGSYKWLNWMSSPYNNKLYASALDVTTYYKQQEELMRSVEKFHSLYDYAPDMHASVSANDGKIIECNNTLLNNLDYTRDEVIGKPIYELYHNDCMPEAIKAFKHFKTKGENRNIELILRKKNGEKIEVSLNVNVIRDKQGNVLHSMSTWRDITKLKQSQLQIEKNNKRLEYLLKISQYPADNIQDLLDYSLSIAIDLTDSKIGYIYYYSEEKKQFTLNTWSKNVMNGEKVMNPQTTYDLDSSGFWGEAVIQRKAIIINDYSLNHNLIKGSPEDHVPTNKLLTLPIFSNNKIVAVVGVANKTYDYNETDITQIALLMDAVWKKVVQKSHNQELIIAKERAEESDRLKSAFLATMSHELRTPLNSVIGFSELLSEVDDMNTIQEFGRNINASGNHLLMIIEEIFSISELEAVDAKPNKELFNVSDLFKSIDIEAGKFEGIRKNNLNIEHEINDSINSYFLFADKSKIKQVFFHLISNATKFTLKGTIKYGITFINNTPAFFVSDTGIGISEKHKEAIFDRFIQVEQALTREFDGIGLGLTICKKISDLFNGKIWFESELRKGTTFYFTFPDLIINILNPIDVNDPFLKLT